MDLTQEQIEEYKNSPYHCPSCRSHAIEADEYNFDANSIKVTCMACDFVWNEFYELKRIEPFK